MTHLGYDLKTVLFWGKKYITNMGKIIYMITSSATS